MRVLRLSREIYFLFVGILIIFSGFRWFGTDLYVYKQLFSSSSYPDHWALAGQFYYLLGNTINFQLPFIVVNTFIGLGILHLSSRVKFSSTFIIVALAVFAPHILGGLRQGPAMLVALYSIIIPHFGLALATFTLHLSYAYAFVLLFICHVALKKFKKVFFNPITTLLIILTGFAVGNQIKQSVGVEYIIYTGYLVGDARSLEDTIVLSVWRYLRLCLLYFWMKRVIQKFSSCSKIISCYYMVALSDILFVYTSFFSEAISGRALNTIAVFEVALIYLLLRKETVSLRTKSLLSILYGIKFLNYFIFSIQGDFR